MRTMPLHFAEDDESLQSYSDEESMETAGTEDDSDPRPWIQMDETQCLALFIGRGRPWVCGKDYPNSRCTRRGNSRLERGPAGMYHGEEPLSSKSPRDGADDGTYLIDASMKRARQATRALNFQAYSEHVTPQSSGGRPPDVAARPSEDMGVAQTSPTVNALLAAGLKRGAEVDAILASLLAEVRRDGPPQQASPGRAIFAYLEMKEQQSAVAGARRTSPLEDAKPAADLNSEEAFLFKGREPCHQSSFSSPRIRRGPTEPPIRRANSHDQVRPASDSSTHPHLRSLLSRSTSRRCWQNTLHPGSKGRCPLKLPDTGPVAARNMAAAAGLEAGDNRMVWVAALTKLIALHKAGVGDGSIDPLTCVAQQQSQFTSKINQRD
jgi:hypothetical protein